MKNRELAEMLGGILSQISREPEINFVRLRGRNETFYVIDRRFVVAYEPSQSSENHKNGEREWAVHLSGGFVIYPIYTESNLVSILGIDHVAEFDPDYPHK